MAILFDRSIPSNNCLAFQTMGDSFHSVLHTQFEFEIVYIKSGFGSIQYSDQEKFYSTGDMVILGPNVPHQYFCPESDIHSLSVLFNHNLISLSLFEQDLTKDITEFLKMASSGLIIREHQQTEEANIIEKILNTSGLEQSIYLILLIHKFTGTQNIDSFNIRTNFSDTKKNFGKIQDILTYINHNAHRQLFIDELADRFKMSRSHFSRFFNQNSSLSFNQYLLSIRVERACKLLSYTDKSITEIAMDVGFETISTFNRAFQQFKHQTPSQFRQSRSTQPTLSK